MLKLAFRVLAGLLAAAGATTVVLSGVRAATTECEEWPAFTSVGAKVLTQYSYFTLWSAIVGVIVAAAYAAGFARTQTTWARVARLEAAMMLIVTGLVYNLIIADGTAKQGVDAVTNAMHHLVLPVALPALWVLSMPQRSTRDITWGVIGRALILPTVWVAWCLARGAATGFYPYDFLNAATLGYPTALRNIAGVYVLFFVLTGLLSGVERLLQRPRHTQGAPR
ncbi:hypothetical protein C1Y63_05875 [Corynebacterium sp. 13CS0277]|uniref:Pr6Pr family membrane protein n=1 Tax=Corynebacterium sp. 13CS0277 TaxID=2071994 RepID=UPI000D047ABA|nr:Pr6Pr family membrane protein [Corynebacterium sp. 13CS0277]PRQ11529.1 hypothetical protein C1Y63_05875 [Corynebacterium sp. 13CS0277]